MLYYTRSLILCFLCLAYFNVGQAQDKPLLSEAIKEIVETKGIEGAREYFSEVEALRSQYTVDMEGVVKLGQTYAETGETDKAMAVIQIGTSFMVPTGPGNVSQTQPVPTKKAPAAPAAKSPAREDLRRFIGMYGDPSSESPKRLWVYIGCDGRLVSGANWGDAMNWWLTSDGDRTFFLKDQYFDIRLEFETDSQGNAVSMTHNSNYLPSPLKKMEPVPADWGPCVPPEGG